ncbi:MAG TPA: chromosome partitioning protein ParA, partial [Sphingomicrobium sp.]|nr:chromosome partitioning protein ParA [Sphingomicrobium sp.]
MSETMEACPELLAHPKARRIRSRKIADGVATLIVDATGLSGAERKSLERELHDAAIRIEGVSEVRVAMTASQPNRKL